MKDGPRKKSRPVADGTSRRGFLGRIATILPLALILPWRRTAAPKPESRSLRFRHAHTDERLTVAYWENGRYVPEALERADRFLRDFRTGDVHEIDPALFDILHDLLGATGSTGVYEVISGYRSPKTNEMLRGQGRAVAKNSMHMQGRAIDVRLTGVKTSRLRDAALALKRGGVGYYEKSDFVRVDTGRVRRW